MADELDAFVKGPRWLAITLICTCCAACTATHAANMKGGKADPSEKMYRAHVAHAAPAEKQALNRVGRYVVGKPYMIKGKRYYPKEEPSYDRSGVASWYGSAFQGRRTANGETYDSGHLSAAHATLPLPSYVRVTNLENGSSVIVRVNDRGPYHDGRLIDLSSKAADMLDLKHQGTAPVRVQYVGRPGGGGNDMAFLMASHVKKGRNAPPFSRKAHITTGRQLASNQPTNDHWRSNDKFFWAKHRKFAGNASGASYHPLTSVSDAIKMFAQPLGSRPADSMAFEGTRAYAPITPNVLRAPAGGDSPYGGLVDRIHMVADTVIRAQDGVPPGVNQCATEGGGRCDLQTIPLLGVDRDRRATGSMGGRCHFQGRDRRRGRRLHVRRVAGISETRGRYSTPWPTPCWRKNTAAARTYVRSVV
ncbi:septal ring lytic transglycosylase RlpA family protein [Ensifer canadensis]